MMKKQFILATVIFLALIAAAVAMIFLGPKPAKRPPESTVRSVKSMTVRECEIAPLLTAYGEAAPEKTYTAIAQVGGRIVWMNPNLKNGEFVEKDDLLIRIDKREYELAVKSGEAKIKQIEAQILQNEISSKNTVSRLEIMKQTLDFKIKSLERQKILLDSNAASASSLESEEINVLDQRNTIAALEAELNLLPSQKHALEAELNSAKISLEQATLNLGYCEIRAPFDGRVNALDVEEQQYSSAGTKMFQIDSTARAEIATALSVDQLALLIGSKPSEVMKAASPSPGAATDGSRKRKPHQDGDIFVYTAGETNRRKGTFLRFSAEVDPATRMVSLVIAVDRPYDHNGEEFSFPLSKGVFCNVEFRGAPRKAIVIPRNAVHNDKVYVIDAESRLEIRPCKIRFAFEQFAVLENTLKDGETLVTSDIVPAIAGMKLNCVPDESFNEKIKHELCPAAPAASVVSGGTDARESEHPTAEKGVVND